MQIDKPSNRLRLWLLIANGSICNRMLKITRTSQTAGSCFFVVYMKQDEKWNIQYQEIKDFIETNHRNPSRHRLEEHLLLNWVKQQRKLMNAGTLKPERLEPLKRLLELIEENKRINQYK